MKKHLFFILGLALTFILFTISCTEPEHNPNDIARVYVAGGPIQHSGPAVLWINGGIIQILDRNAYAVKAVCVNGSDIYVGGTNANKRPVVWKNGIPQILSDEIGNVYDLKAVDGKIYAAGSSGQNAAYWVDGVMTKLPNNPNMGGFYEARAIWVEGTDIHVCGTTRNENRAAYWKNGTFKKLADFDATAEDICFYNGNLYIVGEFTYRKDGIWKSESLIWINGAAIHFINIGTGLSSRATGIAIVNDEPYVTIESWFDGAGTGRNHGFLWKNGELSSIDGCNPKDIFVHNGDIYIAGSYNNGSENKPVVLKNGKKFFIAPVDQSECCNAIFVK